MMRTLLLTLLIGTLGIAQEKTLAPVTKNQNTPGVTSVPAIPKTIVPVAGQTIDRMAQVKTYFENYHAACARFVELVARSPEDEKAGLLSKAPAPSSTSYVLCQMVLANATDEAALEALVFLARTSDIQRVSKLLESFPQAIPEGGTAKIKPLELILKHHVNNPKIADVFLKSPWTPEMDSFTQEAFAKTVNPDVRGKAGFKLASELLREDNEAKAEPLLESLAKDRYLENIFAASKSVSVKQWAEGKLREIRLLKVGKVLPEVYGETLEGKKQAISDFRGKVVVMDVWTTWCGPCKAMIPHQREMVNRLKGKPFELLSISCDEEKEALVDFLKKNDMSWKHWWVGRRGEFSKSLNINVYPTIYVLDGKGVIRFKNIRGNELDKAIDSLLAEEK
jgi:thiol-disulfide isomerase/thioredoxin